MYTNKGSDAQININDLTPDEAGVIQSAILLLADQTKNGEHARTLRRVAMQIDKQLPQGEK